MHALIVVCVLVVNDPAVWSLNETRVGTVVLGAYYTGSSVPAAASAIVSLNLPRQGGY